MVSISDNRMSTDLASLRLDQWTLRGYGIDSLGPDEFGDKQCWIDN